MTRQKQNSESSASCMASNNVVTLNLITSMSKITNSPNGTFPLLGVFVFFSVLT